MNATSATMPGLPLAGMRPFSTTMQTSRFVGLAALGLFILSGCAQPTTSASTGQVDPEVVAREQVAELARDISAVRPVDIDGWARAAVSANHNANANIELIGIDAAQKTDLSKPFGRLDFRVPVPALENESTGDPGEYCFSVEFDYYGKVGTWDSSDGVDPIDCPTDAAVVEPPVDESAVAVVSANAREVTKEVLLERLETGRPATEDGIVTAISEQLASAAGEFEVVARPRVYFETSSAGDRIGVAFGYADDCVLVKSENGAVEDVYPAPVTLQPGELGCTPQTAVADPDQLSSPH